MVPLHSGVLVCVSALGGYVAPRASGGAFGGLRAPGDLSLETSERCSVQLHCAGRQLPAVHVSVRARLLAAPSPLSAGAPSSPLAPSAAAGDAAAGARSWVSAVAVRAGDGGGVVLPAAGASSTPASAPSAAAGPPPTGTPATPDTVAAVTYGSAALSSQR